MSMQEQPPTWSKNTKRQSELERTEFLMSFLTIVIDKKDVK